MDQLQEIVRLVSDTLGANALGIYLHGSAVGGGLKPASDIDIMVVCGQSLTGRERLVLTQGLLPISGWHAAARSIELTVVVRSQVNPWRFPPICDFLYGDWLRDEIAAGGPPQPAPSGDLAVLISMTLAGDHPLAGPPPAQLLAPVPSQDLARGCVEGVPGLLHDLAEDTRNVVLTLARIWTTLATGEIRSKEAAADWALAQLPPEHRPVLQHAKQLYLTRTYREEKPWSDDLKTQIRPHVDAVLIEIDRLAAR